MSSKDVVIWLFGHLGKHADGILISQTKCTLAKTNRSDKFVIILFLGRMMGLKHL